MLYCNHKPLALFFTTGMSSPVLDKQALELQQFNIKFQHLFSLSRYKMCVQQPILPKRKWQSRKYAQLPKAYDSKIYIWQSAGVG